MSKTFYMENDINTINSFIKKQGKLLFISDASGGGESLAEADHDRTTKCKWYVLVVEHKWHNTGDQHLLLRGSVQMLHN